MMTLRVRPAKIKVRSNLTLTEHGKEARPFHHCCSFCGQSFVFGRDHRDCEGRHLQALWISERRALFQLVGAEEYRDLMSQVCKPARCRAEGLPGYVAELDEYTDERDYG